MILVDANVLLYAEDSLSPLHQQTRSWWDAQLSGSDTVCLSWVVASAYIRIGTSRRVFQHPRSVAQATARVQSWLDQPCTRPVQPTQRHWVVFQQMLTGGQARGNMVTDAHLAALAIEHGCMLCSSDSDCGRFPTLKWQNPLA